jgi:hypothetical protein
MKSLLRIGSQLIVLLLIGGILAPNSGGQSPLQPGDQPPAQTAIVRSVRVIPDRAGAAVEIISNRPIVPTIKKLDGPPRIVIDLPNVNLAVRRKRIEFTSQEISTVRVDQYQNNPPVVRVVVDLVKPSSYTWDAAGNRLMVRLHRAEETAAQPPAVPAFTAGVQPAVVPVSRGRRGAVVLAGSRVAAGSSVTAGADTAILSLSRGGQVRVCPGTTVSVTTSHDGHELMLGMSTGALEAHYTLDASADSVLTPDFRILLAGPGEFHYAIHADSRGNTCVRALPGNTASAIVSELMGDGTYQVKPTEQVVFRSGRLNLLDTAVPEDCGCPAPAVPIMRASVPSGPVIQAENLPATMRLARPGNDVTPVPPPVSTSGLQLTRPPASQVTLSVAAPETAPLPASQPNEVHVQVDAPFIYRATDPQLPPAPTQEAESLSATYSRQTPPLPTTVLPPPAEAQGRRPHHGFFGKIKGFFAAIFR